MNFRNIKINSCGKVHCRPDWCWETGKFNDYDLWVIFGGRGKLLDYGSGIEYELSAGDCFILQRGGKYLGTTDKKEPLVVIYTHFDFKGKAKNNAGPRLYRRINNIPFFESVLNRVVLRFAEGLKDEAELWLSSAFAEIADYDKSSFVLHQNVSILKITIERIRTEILEYPEKHYSLKDITAKTGFCRDYFSKTFKVLSGISFMAFLISARMEKAKYFLRCTTLRIGEIARLSGYDDIYLFSKQFKHKTGVSPVEYRKKEK
jgi:AraC-like DNA-binding protein